MPSFLGDPPAAANITALADRRELALVAIERTRMPMVITDPRQADNPIVLANQAFLDLTQYTADEVIGQNCRFLQGPGTSELEVARLRDAMRAEDDHIELELLNYRKDGSTFWNQLGISAVRGPAGEILYYFGSQKDVTARRHAEDLEATERVLLAEVDHRAMNALALVQSIIRLTRADSIHSFASSVLGRVDALARAHRLLALSGWEGARVGELVTSIAQQLDIELAGTEIQLPARLVQPLALVIHELASNARKYGAGKHHGSIKAAWESSPEMITMEWFERGIEPPSTIPKYGLGLQLVERVVQRQLEGKLEMDWADGVYARVQVPTEA